MVLDLYDLCAEDLKATLKEHRNILTEREDLRLQNRHGIKGKVSTSATGSPQERSHSLLLQGLS